MEFDAVALKKLAEKIVANLEALGGQNVQIGIPGDSSMPSSGGATNAEIGFYHERGAPEHNLPARPFLIPGVEKAQPKILSILEKAIKKAVTGDADIPATLESIGLLGVSEVRKVWDDNEWSPLAESTVKAKGRKHPGKKNQILVDTGALRQAITYVVNGDGADIDA